MHTKEKSRKLVIRNFHQFYSSCSLLGNIHRTRSFYYLKVAVI